MCAARSTWFVFAFLFFAFGLGAVGCGVPGEPRTRRPVVPSAITDLAAHQAGSSVVLTFTLPKASLEGRPLLEHPSIEIYRRFSSPQAVGKKTPESAPAIAIPSALIAEYLKDGHVEFADNVPPEDFANHAGEQLIYVVRTRASAKRASADSNVVAVRVYPVPASISGARASVRETAIELSWSAPPQIPQGVSLGGYRVYRAELDPSSLAEAAEGISKAKLKSPMALLAAADTAYYRDTQFEFGRAYLYSIRSVVATESGTIESADSNPVVVEARDTFPPAPPQGLVGVVVPATPEAAAYVELSWGISSETDWAGYHVYRSEQEGSPGNRLSQELLLAPTFRDISVEQGKRYFYRVTAVDKAGNESAVSAAAAIDLPRQSP